MRARIEVGCRSGGRCRAKSSRFWTIRRVRVASSTRRSALWRRSSGRFGSRRMSWLNPRIAASGLLSSWATPETSWPVASIFCAWISSACRRSCSVRSREPDEEPRLAVELDARDLDVLGESLAIAPDADRTAREGGTHRELRDAAPASSRRPRRSGRARTGCRPRSHSRSARNIRCAASLASTTVPEMSVTTRASGDSSKSVRYRRSDPSNRSRRRKFASEIEAIVATRSSAPRSICSSAGGRSKYAAIPPTTTSSIRIGMAAYAVTPAARAISTNGMGTTPGSNASRNGALARAPAPECRSSVRSLLAEPVGDRRTDIDEAPGAVGLAVWCQQAVRRARRPKGRVDQATRAFSQLVDGGHMATDPGELVEGPQAGDDGTLVLGSAHDLLDETSVLETRGDLRRDEQDGGIGRDRRVVRLPAERRGSRAVPRRGAGRRSGGCASGPRGGHVASRASAAG